MLVHVLASAIAVSADGLQWVLCGAASPDVRAQLTQSPVLQPHSGAPAAPVAAVMLVDGRVEHALGLTRLCGQHPQALEIWSTDAVRKAVAADPPLRTLLQSHCGVHWHRMALDEPFELPALPGVLIWALPVPGSSGPRSPGRRRPCPGDNIALLFHAGSGRQLLYAPGLGGVTAAVAAAFAACDVLLVGGTFWSDEEAIPGGGGRRARELGRLPRSGAGGLLEQLARLPASSCRILTHINDTDPVLDRDSPERAQLAQAGIEVAVDGMALEL